MKAQSTKPKQFAVIGSPISHSLSPWIHQQFAAQTGIDLTYDAIEVDAFSFEKTVIDFFEKGGDGLNITSPHKAAAFQLAQIKSSRCYLAANTLWQVDGKVMAENTDGMGLVRDLSRYTVLSNKSILLLGAGGAVCTVLGALLAANPKRVILANRTFQKAVALVDAFLRQKGPHPLQALELTALNGDYDVVIHATAANLSTDKVLFPSTLFKNEPLCYDLSYSQHAATAFVMEAKRHGCVAVDGVGMLLEQAALAFHCWHGVMPDTKPLLDELMMRQLSD